MKGKRINSQCCTHYVCIFRIIKLKIIVFQDKVYILEISSQDSGLLLGLLSRQFVHASIPTACGKLVCSYVTSNNTRIEINS